MKKYIYSLFFLLAGICTGYFLIGLVIFSFLFSNHIDTSSERLLYQCQEYEIQGVLPKESCECSKKLFPKFSESYDWIDACEILKAKNINK